ncbi:MAG: chemotaxis protein CheX [Moraxellaceae bacterium]|nr:chemotaxis protein CheX [Moraxellaceae bacterium]
MAVKAEKLNVFIDSVIAFFAQIGESLEDIDTPYLNPNNAPVAYDYTGIINITGPYKGCVYVSAPSSMLRKILKVMQEPDITLLLMKDLVGEIANTVSGNARSEFGSEFIISPPKIIEGAPNAKFLPKEERTYVIPFHWLGDDGMIGICIS